MSLTKNDLKLIRGVVHEVVDEVVVEKVTDIVAENNQVIREEMIQFKDDILGEIVKLREDVVAASGYKDQIENHEERLVKVETKLGISY